VPRDAVASPLVYTLEEAAEALRLSPTTVKRLIRDGALVVTRLTPGRTHITAEHLERFVRERADEADHRADDLRADAQIREFTRRRRAVAGAARQRRTSKTA
jgi:excisionase family DNA binding protein